MVLADAIGCLVAAFTLSPARGDDFQAPATISREGQEALAEFSRKARNAVLPAPDDLEAWKVVQAGVEKKWAAAAAAVVERYGPLIEDRVLGGVPVLDIKPKGWKESDKVLVYTHGGAYTLYSARSRLLSAVPMASDTGLRVISVDYTLAPGAKWNEVTDEVVAVIEALRGEGRSLEKIAIYGESAGGGMAAGTKTTSERLSPSTASCAIIRCPMWTGSNEPPMMPIRFSAGKDSIIG